MKKDGINWGCNENGQKISKKSVNEACARTGRSSAKNASWKSRLMLET